MADSGPSLPLAEIARRMDQARIPWAVFAGAAVSIYTDRETYTDIDILIRCEDGERVSVLFTDASKERRKDGSIGCIGFPGIEIIAGLTHYCSLAMDDAMISRLIRGELDGVSVPVVSVEDNIAIKAMFGRGPELGKHDWDDVADMITHTASLDWDYLNWRLQECTPQLAEGLLINLKQIWKEK